MGTDWKTSADLHQGHTYTIASIYRCTHICVAHMYIHITQRRNIPIVKLVSLRIENSLNNS